jgi:hypothetical protein
MTADRQPLSESQTSVLTLLSRNRKQVSYGFIALAVALALIPILMFAKYRWEYASVTFWGAALALIALGTGLWLKLGQPEESANDDLIRIMVLLVGGLAGFFTWVLSLALGYQWKTTILGGLDAWQGPNWWQLWICLLALFGGLGLMFASLFPARVLEHTNAAVRRLVYGYNAALTGLLLLAILIVVNVLAYNYFTLSLDWTESGIYSLSDKSKNILRALEKPAKVYAVVSSGNDAMFREIHTLLDNCKAVNEKLQVEYVAPDLDISKLRKLINDYQFNERQGLVVVYGSEGQSEHQIIKGADLFASDPDPRSPRGRFVFKGEDALMTAFSALEEGKSRTVVYFTQGNGELDINSMDSSPDNWAMGTLRERLQKGNYEVKGLQFTPVAGVKSKSPLVTVSTKVPDDANVVVVAGPRTPLPDHAIKALRDYVNAGGADAKKKGKLVVLLDVTLDPAKNLVQTGLEPLLAEFKVTVGNNRILSLPTNQNRGDPLKVVVRGNPRSRNPVAVMFSRWAGFLVLPNVRTIQSQASSPGVPGSGVSAEPILAAPSQIAWTETNFQADPGQLVNALMNNEQELAKKLSQEDEPLPVAVAVGEPQPPAGGDPHEFMRQPELKPRLVVFGSAAFATNQYMAESSPLPNYDLLASTLAWLRERPSNIGLEPKKRNLFVLNVPDEQAQRMRYLPAMTLLVGIVGLGTGVWLVRRR